MGPRAGLDMCGKSRRHRDSIPGPSSPQPVVIPTELPGPRSGHRAKKNISKRRSQHDIIKREVQPAAFNPHDYISFL